PQSPPAAASELRQTTRTVSPPEPCAAHGNPPLNAPAQAAHAGQASRWASAATPPSLRTEPVPYTQAASRRDCGAALPPPAPFPLPEQGRPPIVCRPGRPRARLPPPDPPQDQP